MVLLQNTKEPGRKEWSMVDIKGRILKHRDIRSSLRNNLKQKGSFFF